MASPTKFRRLLEPMQLKQIRLKNRIVKAPQRLGFVDQDYHVTQQGIDFYENVAKGGVGLVIVDFAFVDFPMGVKIRQISIADDKSLPQLTKLTGAVHAQDCPIILQMGHSGPDHDVKVSGGQTPLAPSVLNNEEVKELYPGDSLVHVTVARALTLPEIEQLIVKFADAAERAKKAGFDGIEIHGAHAYLVATFFSRVWNKRTDKYGSESLENRARFATDILQAIRKRVGNDFVVGIRINGGEYGHKSGSTAAEVREFAKFLQAAGADYISVTAWGYAEYQRANLPEQIFYPEPPEPFTPELNHSPKGTLVPLAAGIKKVVSIPVFAAGRIDPVLGEYMLRKNMADAICMGRKILADPELPHKLATGTYEDISPCTTCITCSETTRGGSDVKCRINAAIGLEKAYEIKPATLKKKVVVVGGGPAGMEAARIASLRGHDVTLYEKESKLGGVLPLAALIKGTEIEEIPAISKYLEKQIRKQGVKVNLGTKFTPALAREIKPDVLIVANGAIPVVPSIPGVESKIVMTTNALKKQSSFFLNLFGPEFLNWATKFYLPIGKNVVIVGGLIYGLEAAEFLIKRGRKVTIVEETDKLGTGILESHLPKLLAWLKKKGTTMMTGVKYEEITGAGLVVSKNGQKQLLKADTILITVPPKRNEEYLAEFKAAVREVYQIGDGKEPRLIVDAIGEGSKIGRTI